MICVISKCIPSNLLRQYNCWSLRCCWSIACRRCSNYIFILGLTPGFNGLGKELQDKTRSILSFGDIVCLILQVSQYMLYWFNRTCYAGSHYWNHYFGGVSVSQVLATHYTLCFNEVERGVYWFHVVRPSVRLSVCLSVYKIMSILYLP